MRTIRLRYFSGSCCAASSVSRFRMLNCTCQCFSSHQVRMICIRRRVPASPATEAGLNFRLIRSPSFSR